MRIMRIAVCAAAALAGACASPEDLGVEVVPGVQPLADDDDCPKNTCGNGNSPVINGVYFWRLHIGSVPGVVNDEGVRIISVTHPSTLMPLQLEVVDGDRLRGVAGSETMVDAYKVKGTQIAVEVNGQQYEITINAVARTEKFWVGNQSSIWVYDFRYRPLSDPDLSTPSVPLCSEANEDPPDPTKVSAIVFGGDLYDPKTKNIVEGAVTSGWLNIACVASATYKMYKIGHTSAAQARAQSKATSIEQRRAMLNAWTSNVCGTGRSFTKQGQPIKLVESRGVLPLDSDYLDPLDKAETQSIEAIWSEAGAVCLNLHRREAEEPGITDKLRNTECGKVIETCDSRIGNWTAHGHVLTGVPYPLPQ